MSERTLIAAACLNFIKTSDALSHGAIREKLIQTDLAVAGVTWAEDEWRSAKCNNKPLSLARQLISIQMNLALCKTWALLSFYFVRLDSLCLSHGVPMKYTPRLGCSLMLLSPPSPSSVWGEEAASWKKAPTLAAGGLHACLGILAAYDSHYSPNKSYQTRCLFFQLQLLNVRRYYQDIKSTFLPSPFAEKAWNIEQTLLTSNG